MRTILVGDLHGCLAEFRELLQRVGYERGVDRLVCLGDFMDRGPDPAGCVKFAREQGAEGVQGNHEEKWLRWFKHEAKKAAQAALGKEYKNPMKSLSEEKVAQGIALSVDDRQWLASLPYTLELGDNWIAVHAGFEPGVAFADQEPNTMMRVRYVDKNGKFKGYREGSLKQPKDTVYWTKQWKGPWDVVYGHAVHSLRNPRLDLFGGSWLDRAVIRTMRAVGLGRWAPRPVGRCYGIDTGCCFGGRLTAMILVSGQEPEFVQVKAARVYCSRRGNHDA
jgi:bis(5'-nucleosyl)-tetraphosphatase (symmetrical)